MQTTKNNNIVINGAISASVGTTGGITISGTKVIPKQSTDAVNGVLYNLNESGCEYMIITFK